MRLSEIIDRIVESPSNKSAWNELFQFAPVILTKPEIGGVKRNLSSIIIKRTAEWNKDGPIDPPPNSSINNSSHEKKDDDQILAAAFLSKLEAGNLKADLRILAQR